MKTKKQAMKKIRSMMKTTRAEILKEAEHLLRSGAIPWDDTEDNFRIPKAVLTVAMRKASWQWSPLNWDDQGKALVKNLERM